MHKSKSSKIEDQPKSRELVVQSLPLVVSEYAEGHEHAVVVLLRANSGKVEEMQPVLLGSVTFGGQTLGLSLWWGKTRDNTRDYYSMSIVDEAKRKEAFLQKKDKPEPLARLKIYQFRQNDPGDPDFVSGTQLVHEGAHYWVLLWVIMPEDFPDDPTEEDLKRIQYVLVFSPTRPVEKWEKSLTESFTSSHDFLRERRQELEARSLLKAKQAKRATDYFEADKIP